ncbi:hypothetical protein Droror1_Dr00026902, partial [Drosera rotundifolia]
MLGFNGGGWNVVNLAVLMFIKGRWKHAQVLQQQRSCSLSAPPTSHLLESHASNTNLKTTTKSFTTTISFSAAVAAVNSGSVPREKADFVVIGAGIIGLTIARELAMKGREVLVVESGTGFGTGTSSRNSE